MPFFRDPNLDDNGQQGGAVQLSSAGQQADPSGATQDSPSQSQGSSTNTGSHFQNLDSYLKNNDAQGAGQKFGANVQKSIDQAKQTIDTSSQDVKNQINGGANPATQEQIQGAIASAGTNTKPEDIKKYQDWTNQSYTGPSSLADNSTAQSQIEGGIGAAQTKARLAGTESGRFSLLDQFYGRPSYNFGEKALDNALIERGGGFSNPGQYQEQAAQLGSYGDQAAKGIQEAASQRAGQFDQSKNAARAAIGLQPDNTVSGGAIGDFQTQLKNRAAATNKGRDSNYDLLMQELQKGNLTPSEAQELGLKGGEQLYNLRPQDYLVKGADASDRAYGSDYARLAALSQMAGTTPSYADAGKPAFTPNSFDMGRFKEAEGEAQAQYQNNFKNVPLHSGNPLTDGRTPAQLQSMLNDYGYNNGAGTPAVAEGGNAAYYQPRIDAALAALNQFYSEQGLNHKIQVGPETDPNRAPLPKDYGPVLQGAPEEEPAQALLPKNYAALMRGIR